jgi:hypothetical protein
MFRLIHIHRYPEILIQVTHETEKAKVDLAQSRPVAVFDVLHCLDVYAMNCTNSKTDCKKALLWRSLQYIRLWNWTERNFISCFDDALGNPMVRCKMIYIFETSVSLYLNTLFYSSLFYSFTRVIIFSMRNDSLFILPLWLGASLFHLSFVPTKVFFLYDFHLSITRLLFITLTIFVIFHFRQFFFSCE